MTQRKIASVALSVLLVCSFMAFAQAAPPAPGADGSFQVNDRVQTNANGFGWITGTVIEIGKGDQAGNVKVHADGYPNDFWVRATMSSAIRKAPGAGPAPASTANVPPRMGKYLVQSFGASSRPLHLGYVVLSTAGSYKFLDMGGKATGDGRYEYDSQASQVRWISGPILDNKWGGKFEVTREGKTHNIRLTRTTVAVNSTDGAK